MTSFAEKQLQKFGWSKGQGLGKNNDGISKAISVSQKTDNSGLGTVSREIDSFSFHWWDHAFNKAASNIQIAPTTSKDESVVVSRKAEYARTDLIVTNPKSLSNNNDNNNNAGFIKGGATEQQPLLLSTAHMTDEQLFKLCKGRTAHKGARSSMNGKLKRAADAGIGLPSITESSSSKDTKKKKSRNRDKKRKLCKNQN